MLEFQLKKIFSKSNIQKIKRKLRDLHKQVSKKNIHLRPTKVYVKGNLVEYKEIEVYPDYKTKLSIEKGLFDSLSAFTIYDNVSNDKEDPALEVVTSYKLHILENGRLYSNNNNIVSIISHDNQLIGDCSFQYKKGKTVIPEQSPIFRRKYFEEPTIYEGTVFSMLAGGGAARGNYGHWLIDVLPRLWLVKETNFLEKIDWFIVPQYRHDFQKETLAHFGVEAHQVIEGNEDLHIRATRLVASTHPRGARSFLIPDWIVDFYQQNFDLDRYESAESPRFIYISRKDSSQRKVIDEDLLIHELENLNFKSLELSQYNFYQKLKLFRNAEFIVSPTGAGLATLFFCKKNSKILEIFSESFVHTHYYNVAKSVGLRYQYLVFPSKKVARKMSGGIKEHVSIDVAAIMARVREMM